MKKGLDLTDRRFGRLRAKENTRVKQDGYYVWHCECDCGGEILVNTKRLLRGTITNCGCVPKNNAVNGSQAEELTGRRFGELTVIERAENRRGRVCWKCRCSCGEEGIYFAQRLKAGKVKSCGRSIHQKELHSKDLKGYETGFLRVLEKTEQRDYKSSVMWRCVCQRCGKEVLRSADVLMHGRNVSCGCYRQEVIRSNIHSQTRLIDGTCVDWLCGKRERHDNTSGFRGVNKKGNETYTAMIGFKRKRYHLGTFLTFQEAVDARIRAEELIHQGFTERYKQWARKAKLDPKWAEQHPLRFEVTKVNGELLVCTE